MANSYLSRTPSSTTNRRTYTFSVWAKFCTGSTSSTLLNVGPYNSSKEFRLTRNASGTLEFYDYNGSSYEFRYRTRRFLRDVSAWYHIVCAVDTTNGTSGDRVKIYVNGSQETEFDVSTAPSVNLDTNFNVNNIFYVGSAANGNYTDGYLSHVALVDGQQLAPTVFGETDSSSGIWKFKSPSGVTWGTNGFHLKFENSGNLGLDSSGNSNTFTVGGNGRQALDTPSNVYATMNALNSWGDNTLSKANLTLTTSSNTWGHTSSTMHMNSGKWYFEANLDAHASGYSAPTFIFSGEDSTFSKNQVGFVADGDGSYGIGSNGRKYTNGLESGSVVFSELSTGDKVNIAFDADAGKIWFGVNGTYLDSGNPSTGANPYFTATTLQNNDVQFTSLAYNSGNTVSFNFGNGYFGTTAISSAGSNGNGSLFEYDVPSGYYALNTKNINTYG
jgi:hypothetical protein